MNKLNYAPEQSAYSVYDSSDRLAINYGIAGKYRRNFFNGYRLVDVSWSNASAYSYNILAQAHRAFVRSGGASFLVDLFIDNTELEEFECVFVRNSFALTEVRGETFSVKAQLLVRPKKYDVVNNPWVTDSGLNRYFAAMGVGAFSVSGKTITFFLSSRKMNIQPANFLLAGKNATFNFVANRLNAESASFSISGKPIARAIGAIDVDTATFGVSGQDSDFSILVSDPFFSDVVLLLRGDSGTDLSSYGHTATIGSHISHSSSVSNGAIGSDAIRVDPAAGANLSWLYASATEWRRQTTFTLDFWLYFDATPGNIAVLGKTSGQPFWQSVGTSLFNQGWTSGANITAPISAWHYIRVVANGTESSWYFNGNRIGIITSGLPTDGSDIALDVTDPIGIPMDGRLMQIRWTQGVARSDPNDLTCPMQTDPWPEF